MFTLVNTVMTVARNVSISSDDETVQLDQPVYWDQLVPEQHETFGSAAPLSVGSVTPSLNILWRDHSGLNREKRFPSLHENRGRASAFRFH